MLAQKAKGPSIGEILVKARVVSEEQLAQATKRAAEERARLEEVLIDQGMVGEAPFLKALATAYQTQFVSSENLSKIAPDKPTLAAVPREAAEALAVLPVKFDPKTGTLIIVTADPSDVDVIRNVQGVSQARTVKAYVARARAVKSAIAKVYGGELSAFGWLNLENASHFYGFEQAGRAPKYPDAARREGISTETPLEIVLPRTVQRDGGQPTPPAATPVAAPVPPAAPTPPPASVRAKTEPGVTYAFDDVLELMNVFVSVIEHDRPDLRGHSTLVAKFARRVGEKMSVPTRIIQAHVAAAHAHDLGKGGQYHLTALNVAEYEGHRVAAQKLAQTPVRLLEGVKLPGEVGESAMHMYERFDGKGFPGGLTGRQIPLGARVLAAADTYADLTSNPRNPFRKQLTPQEALEVLTKFRGSIFDPEVVDVFQNIVMGDDLKAKLMANRYVALLVDPDASETSVLELRMVDQGFEVRIARNADQAKTLLGESKVDLVVSEIDLPGMDGLQLLAETRGEAWGKDLAWVMHTKRTGRAEANKAFEHGVIDFVNKPANTDVLVAKLKARLDRNRQKGEAQSGGLTGSLKELGLPELVQVLTMGRKTGAVKITSSLMTGEIQFLDGSIVNASAGRKRGATAFYDLLRLADGQFVVDPAFKPKERLITDSTEALLLEGMRRIDEGIDDTLSRR